MMVDSLIYIVFLHLAEGFLGQIEAKKHQN